MKWAHKQNIAGCFVLQKSTEIMMKAVWTSGNDDVILYLTVVTQQSAERWWLHWVKKNRNFCNYQKPVSRQAYSFGFLIK